MSDIDYLKHGLEGLTADLQKTCLEEVALVREILRNRDSEKDFDIEQIAKTADALRKWAMLWIDLEKRKPKKCEHDWQRVGQTYKIQCTKCLLLDDAYVVSKVDTVDTSEKPVDETERCRHEWQNEYYCMGDQIPDFRKCKLCGCEENYGEAWVPRESRYTGYDANGYFKEKSPKPVEKSEEL